MSCVFCDIIFRKGPATLVHEWDEAIAIEPLKPVTGGHVLVIPRLHVPDAMASPLITAMVMGCAVDYARGHKVGPCNFITSVGAEATQTIMHLHIHVVPRVQGDNLHLPWTGQERREKLVERFNKLWGVSEDGEGDLFRAEYEGDWRG